MYIWRPANRDDLGFGHQGIPGIATGVEDRLISVPDAVAEPVAAQILPDVLCRVQLVISKTAAWHAGSGERVGNLQGRTRRIAIVAMARKLLIAIWRYATTGIVPEGAQISI
jgi:hypothetical protein